MRTSRIRTATLAAVTAALALGLTACGGADGGSKAAGGDNAAGSAQSPSASNGGGKPCWVTSYPAVKLGDVDVVLPHSKKDNPGGDKHITLRPGGKAYSAVNLFDYGSKDHTAQSFAIALRGADGHDGPFYSVDAKGEKPQFSWNEADVLNWNTKKPYDF
ncbi:DUF4232 domain-containing protein [Streptomyces violens]|uniref:DUF4232 domain-containing protein n=1 Tax=Streptomyces violens TaxID=66377 RepID=UPI0004C02408|nr:DUF4232 domain-containing protein [Streptomyces violens]